MLSTPPRSIKCNHSLRFLYLGQGPARQDVPTTGDSASVQFHYSCGARRQCKSFNTCSTANAVFIVYCFWVYSTGGLEAQTWRSHILVTARIMLKSTIPDESYDKLILLFLCGNHSFICQSNVDIADNLLFPRRK